MWCRASEWIVYLRRSVAEFRVTVTPITLSSGATTSMVTLTETCFRNPDFDNRFFAYTQRAETNIDTEEAPQPR